MANKGGRPTKFKDEFVEQVEKLAKIGATEEQIAEFFEVTYQTVYNWKQSNEAFREAMLAGKEIADAAVERSLFQRATGYSHAEEKIFCSNGEVVRAESTKHYPPDATSCIFWLKNRKPDDWRDKREVTGSDGGPLTVQIVQFSQSDCE